ncbi:hypothetical protein BVRB_7g165140 [Beta vulgaris subsp. vulgaris]|nr:hypothetical protein BVRB_7g165140 [Beta vulgaris subsp. vulgaris]
MVGITLRDDNTKEQALMDVRMGVAYCSFQYTKE